MAADKETFRSQNGTDKTTRRRDRIFGMNGSRGVPLRTQCHHSNSRAVWVVALASGIILSVMLFRQTQHGLTTDGWCATKQTPRLTNNFVYLEPTFSPVPVQLVQRIHLIGERNSGTNYIERILKGSLPPRYGKESSFPYSEGILVLGYKHMWRHFPLNETELQILHNDTSRLWVLAVRAPCDWADGMFRKPYHMCNPNGDDPKCTEIVRAFKREYLPKELSSFFQMPWLDSKESHSPVRQNFTYANVFELRRHKLSIMSQLINAVHPNRVVIAHLKSIEADPERFVQDLVKAAGLELATNRTVLQKSTNEHSLLCLSEEEHAIAHQEIDWEMESRFGFIPLDCRMCA